MTLPPPSEAPTRTTRRSRGRVLIVDNDYDALGALAKAIRERGHQVVLAADGRQGLQRAVEVTPDVVLVDWKVSALDVRTFLEVLRDNPRTGGAQAFVMGDGEIRPRLLRRSVRNLWSSRLTRTKSRRGSMTSFASASRRGATKSSGAISSKWPCPISFRFSVRIGAPAVCA